MEVDPFGTEIYTAAELAAELGECLRSNFPDTIMVQGEVSDLKRSQAGHVYFNLLEPATPGQQSAASLPVALFSSNKQPVNTLLKRAGVGRIQDGMPLRIRTAVDFYAARGTLSLAMSGVDPTYTLNSLSTQRELLLNRLLDEGLDNVNKRLTMPRSPERIGLVTSIGSAAYADFVEELKQGPFSWDIQAADSRVQGPEAERSLVSAIKTLARDASVELIVIIRGGGSRGDLATFDSEHLAKTIAHCPVPVLTGIGHEIDTSIADVVSYQTYKTPTACAVALTEHVATSLATAELSWQSICQLTEETLAASDRTLRSRAAEWTTATSRVIRSQETRTIENANRLVSRSGQQLDATDTRLAMISQRLRHTMQQTTAAASEKLALDERTLKRRQERSFERALREIDNIENQVRALDPRRTLARGWSITRNEAGEIVRSSDQVTAGEVLVTDLSDGNIMSQVTRAE